MRTEHRAVATNFLAPDRYTEAIRSAGEGSCLRVYLDVAVVLNFLVDQFGIAPISTVENDLK